MALTTLDPKTALVLIDLQYGIVAPPAVPRSGAEVVARAKELANTFRAQGLPVVLVNVVFSPDFGDAPKGRDGEEPEEDENETEKEEDEERVPADFAVIVDELGAQDTDIRVTKHQGVPSTAPTWTPSSAAAASRRSSRPASSPAAASTPPRGRRTRTTTASPSPSTRWPTGASRPTRTRSSGSSRRSVSGPPRRRSWRWFSA